MNDKEGLHKVDHLLGNGNVLLVRIIVFYSMCFKQHATLHAVSLFGVLDTDIPCESLRTVPDGTRTSPALSRSLGRFECSKRAHTVGRSRPNQCILTVKMVSVSFRFNVIPNHIIVHNSVCTQTIYMALCKENVCLQQSHFCSFLSNMKYILSLTRLKITVHVYHKNNIYNK